jgi:hypothetical protein
VKAARRRIWVASPRRAPDSWLVRIAGEVGAALDYEGVPYRHSSGLPNRVQPSLEAL